MDLDGRDSHAQEAPTIHPAPDVFLQDKYLAGEHAVALLLEEQVVCILEEYFGLAELVVRPTQNLFADLSRCIFTFVSLRKMKEFIIFLAFIFSGLNVNIYFKSSLLNVTTLTYLYIVFKITMDINFQCL